MQESYVEAKAAAATAADENRADRIFGADDGRGARESAASEAIMEEKRMNEDKKHSESGITSDYRLVTTIDAAKRYI